MERKSLKAPAGTAGEARADRLKAALRANIARRKAQAKARKEAPGGAGAEPGATGGQDGADGQDRKG